MALNDGSKIEALAENVYTRILARYSMIVLTCVGLPIMGWSVNEAYGVIKEMNRDQNKLTRTVDALALKLDFASESQRASVAQTELKIEAIRAEIRDRTQGRYTTEDAQRDLKLRDQVIQQHERRITDLERLKPGVAH